MSHLLANGRHDVSEDGGRDRIEDDGDGQRRLFNGFVTENGITNDNGSGSDGGSDSEFERVMTPLRSRLSEDEDAADGEDSDANDAEDDGADGEGLEPFVPPRERDDAPLWQVVPPELEDIDPRTIFPDFKPHGILRFSKIVNSTFKSNSHAHLYYSSKSFDPHPQKRNADLRQRLRNGQVKPFEPTIAATYDQIIDDTEEFLKTEGDTSKDNVSADNEIAGWRNGPAKIWYDMYRVPVNAIDYDYDVARKKNKLARQKLQQQMVSNKRPEFEENGDGRHADDSKPSTSFKHPSMIDVANWEDNVIYSPNDAAEKFKKSYANGQLPNSGFIPLKNVRTFAQFQKAWKKFGPEGFVQPNEIPSDGEMEKPPPVVIDSTHSLFPPDNIELEFSDWEKDIIYSSDQVMPKPKIVTIDFEDDPKIFGIPDDIPMDDIDGDRSFDRKDHQFTKKSKIIIGQVQQRKEQQAQEQMENKMALMVDRDPFNCSNDEYYKPKISNRTNALSSGGVLIQHSNPALNIHRSFFPTWMPAHVMRHFHRMPLTKKFLKSLHSDKDGFIPVLSLAKHMAAVEEAKEAKRFNDAGLEVFPVREIADLSAKDGKLLLFEYSEEHPPLLSQPGMASRIRNYCKRAANNDMELKLEFGETVYTYSFPFLGVLKPGEYLQALENNMFRAPIYQHVPKSTDYLLIKSNNVLTLRKCPIPFVVGQECPMMEVPNPNSKKATIFVRDFLLAFIYRLFWASDSTPRRLKMDDIKAAFPSYAESSVRKRLKGCSDFKRLGAGTEQNYWVLRDDFRLPTKEEVLAMITPEMCCAHYSMLAAEQRLKDAGYGEKYIFAGDDENDSDDQVTMEDEIKCAPWNTTRAFLAAQRGKCMLDQTGIADPTGCGAGYSYVRVSAKPQKEDVPQVPKRLVTGTDADLRKLPLKEAKEMCKKHGLKDEEINSLSRWEIIDVIRTLSTQQAKSRSDFTGMARFARGNIKLNYADMEQKYKQYCQQIFDLQNRMLTNQDEVTTDNDSSDEEDDENEEIVNHLESIMTTNLANRKAGTPSRPMQKKPMSKKSKKAGSEVNEQRELDDLRRMVHGGPSNLSLMSDDKEESNFSAASPAFSTGAVDFSKLANVQTVTGPDGNNEVIVSPNLKMSQTTFETLTDPSNKMKKLKIVRTFKDRDGQLMVRSEIISNSQVADAYIRVRASKDEKFIREYSCKDEEYKEEKRKEKRRLQDQLRRIKRNEEKQKAGLTYKKPAAPPKPSKPIKESLLKMRCSACNGFGHMKTNKNCPFWGKLPKNNVTVGDLIVRRDEDQPVVEQTEIDGTKIKIRNIHRQPALKISIPRMVLQKNDVDQEKERERTGGAMTSSSIRTEPDDFDDEGNVTTHTPVKRGRPSTISKPSAIGKQQRRRTTADDFDYLSGPQRSTQRRRADPKVSMASILTEIYQEMKAIPGSEPLMYPVNAKKVPDYYDKIKTPMDMQQIFKNINSNSYLMRVDFLRDVKQMLQNSVEYNGENHDITQAAKQVFLLATRRISEQESQLVELEKAINPLLHENDMVGFAYILREIVESCKCIRKSAAFHTRVDPRKCPTYAEKIQHPMHLGMIRDKVDSHDYITVSQFRRDVELIRTNSEAFNGPQSPYTLKAAEITKFIDNHIVQRAAQLKELQENIRRKNLQQNWDAPEDVGEFSLDAICQRASLEATTSWASWADNVDGDTMSMGGDDSDAPATCSVTMVDDDETRTGFEEDTMGVLEDDLALSDDDIDEVVTQHGDIDMTTDDDDHTQSYEDLLSSNMNSAGQLDADLELSSSDDEMDSKISVKRARLDDDFTEM